MESLELKIPPVVVVTISAGVMWFIAATMPGFGVDLPVSDYLALMFAILGFTFALCGVYAFRKAGTTVDPRVPHQTEALVVNGVYQFSRNPMYVGFLLALIGWGIYLTNLISLFVLPAFILYMNRFQIGPEESFMGNKFGQAYEQYQQAVRRWL